jgi:hypothetical protein
MVCLRKAWNHKLLAVLAVLATLIGMLVPVTIHWREKVNRRSVHN